MIQQDQKLCFYCLKPFIYDKTRDHIVAKVKGGNNNKENIVLAHRKCNKAKDRLSIDEIISIIETDGTGWAKKEFGQRGFVIDQLLKLQVYVFTMGAKLYRDGMYNQPAIRRSPNKGKQKATPVNHKGTKSDKVIPLKKGQPGIPVHLLNRISNMQDAYEFSEKFS